MNACSVDGCDSKARARKFCENHYRKYLAYGDPLAGRSNRKDGAGCVVPSGYLHVTHEGKAKRAHRVIVEEALGKKLPPTAVVHHVDNDRLNNSHDNLVVCPDSAYHQLLHVRQRAMDATGNPNFRKCSYCKKWDSPDNLTFGKGNQYHRLCNNAGVYYKEQL